MLSAFVFAALAAPPPPSVIPDRVTRARDAIDWTRAGDEAVSTLSEYLRIDTVNPPGNEDRAVAFLGRILDAEGIPWHAVPLAPGRSSLVARVSGSGRGTPLCLMHHVDVASFEAERWSSASQGPLSGAVADGAVWGRGALDMKGMGAVELMTLVWLQRNRVPLDRDVVLLAVADEEVDNGGARTLADPAVWWKDIGCSHMINEGGLGVQDALFEGQAVHAVSTAEKGALWVRMVAEGKAGHGSVPHGSAEAPARLLAAMSALDGYRAPGRLDPSLLALLHAVGEQRGGIVGGVLQDPFLVRTLAWGKLRANPVTDAALHDTVHLTGTGGAHEPNVVPSEVWAQYDCRLLPGTTPEQHLERLRSLTAHVPGIRFETTFSLASNGSPLDDPWFATIGRYAIEGREDRAVVGPLLSVGFTDSLLLRPLGVVAYGYVPFEVPAAVADTMHGHDERLPVEQVGDGLRRLFSMVVDFAGTP